MSILVNFLMNVVYMQRRLYYKLGFPEIIHSSYFLYPAVASWFYSVINLCLHQRVHRTKYKKCKLKTISL